jgi:hypothetical protein
MSISYILAKLFAPIVAKRTYKASSNASEVQSALLKQLLEKAKHTKFGKAHHFSQIETYEDYKKRVPVRDYEDLKHYIEEVVDGKPDILWKGKPAYFAKTSGTTSGNKYIPLTKDAVPTHMNAVRNALLLYVNETKQADFLKGKMIFLQGSPELEEKHGIKFGRLSGIAAHYIPKYLQKNRLPTWETNCIDDWEKKVDAIIEETLKEDMTLIGGIPSWVQMYFEGIVKKTGKKVGEVFPNFKLLVFGGVNFEPYKNKFDDLIGRKVDTLELYPASEGFIAYQDKQKETGMLLLVDNGIFYEFIPVDEFYKENPTRLSIAEVQLNQNYVIILSTNAGLWAYNIGDTVSFTSLKPPRIVVTGRIKHFISAFGEHVIGKEVEEAMNLCTKGTEIQVTEFTVVPQVNPSSGLPYHEWLIEFEKEPDNLDEFANRIDEEMQRQNSYYLDLIQGNILTTLKISAIEKGGFKNYMKSIGKLGGQNKVPRLSNDRKIADAMLAKSPK